jgi:hypothetical protein
MSDEKEMPEHDDFPPELTKILFEEVRQHEKLGELKFVGRFTEWHNFTLLWYVLFQRSTRLVAEFKDGFESKEITPAVLEGLKHAAYDIMVSDLKEAGGL